MTVWHVVGMLVAIVLALAAYIDFIEYRRRHLHRRRASHALWLEIDEQSNGMRYGEHATWGMYVPETVPHRPGVSKENRVR